MPTAPAPQSVRLGLIQGVGAFLIWGLLPLYFLLLKGIGSGEVLAARILWSVVLVVIIVTIAGRWSPIRQALATPRTVGLLTITALLISVNWLTYIWAIQHHHVIEASLGYFLNPLVNVLLGVVVLHERLTKLQLAAVALAGAGVAVLATGAGGYLWITGVLAISFSLYGLVRKIAPIEALDGLMIETALLAPLSLGYMIWLGTKGTLVTGSDLRLTLCLAAGGLVTATPLLLFAAAARKLPYSVVGLLQYLAPTLQFILAVTVFDETVTPRHILCFALIWGGIALYVTATLRGTRDEPAAAA